MSNQKQNFGCAGWVALIAAIWFALAIAASTSAWIAIPVMIVTAIVLFLLVADRAKGIR